MYLRTRDITMCVNTQRKIKNQRYYTSDADDLSGLQLQLFTVQKYAEQESKENLQEIFASSAKNMIPTVIVKEQEIQFIGQTHHVATDEIMTSNDVARMDEEGGSKSRWSDSSWQVYADNADYDFLTLNASYDTHFTMPKQFGFYQHTTGTDYTKITDRHTQIQKLWDYGYPSRRGRPCSVGRMTRSGRKDELIHLTEWVEKLRNDGRLSEIGQRTVSNYNSINRQFAWPGHW